MTCVKNNLKTSYGCLQETTIPHTSGAVFLVSIHKLGEPPVIHRLFNTTQHSECSYTNVLTRESWRENTLPGEVWSRWTSTTLWYLMSTSPILPRTAEYCSLSARGFDYFRSSIFNVRRVSITHCVGGSHHSRTSFHDETDHNFSSL